MGRLHFIKSIRFLSISCLIPCFFWVSSGLFGADLIKAPAHVCLGNLAYFSSKINSGVKSYEWQFGNTFSSISAAPFHLYKNSGQFLVKLQITLNDGSKQRDSVFLQVYELPKADFSIALETDTCLFTNQVKINDNSAPSGNGFPLENRLIIWGDGDFKNFKNPKNNDIVDHHYQLKDRYKIKLEITDIKGCKASDISYINIIDGNLAEIKAEISYPSCGEAKVCFTNASKTSNGNNQVYTWNFDSSGFQNLNYNQQTCFSTTSSKFVRAYLSMSNANQTCKSEDYVKVFLDAEGISNQFQLKDSVFCYGESGGLVASNSNANYEYTWLIDDKTIEYTNQILKRSAKQLQLNPGYHKLECIVSKGPCFKSYQTSFRVKGPVAVMKIFNQKQCEIDRRVFFIDTSRFLNKKHAVYEWTVTDPEGENCVINRSANINKYKNCNYSRDWFGKHDYTVPRALNPIHLKVTDTSQGCSDETQQNVEHFHCKLCNREGGISICQGDSFADLKINEIAPLFFTIDGGVTWLPFKSIIPKPYKGWYDVGFIFKNYEPETAEDYGDDWIKVNRNDSTWLDTLFVPKFLYVKERKSNAMTLEIIPGTCKPFMARINIEDSFFYQGDKINIDWGDSTSEGIYFSRDSIMKYITHRYLSNGLEAKVKVSLESYEGCMSEKELSISFGRALRFSQTGKPCLNSELCFETRIDNYSNNPAYNRFKSIFWESSFFTGPVKGEKICYKQTQIGAQFIQVYTEDSLGCKDTITHKFHIRQVKAGVEADSRVFYCSELKQLFDSSYHISKDPDDKISAYYWDFGSGNFTTIEKNPFRSFELEDSLIPVTHVVIDNNGCSDTLQFNIQVIGSTPSFVFYDTVGCAPFSVEFKNNSKKCAAYIWEFGDHNNTTFENTDKGNVKFTYSQAGKYYPKLIGIDTFYNPFTGSVYYCHATYNPKKSITVLKTYFADFKAIDTICLGAELSLNVESNATHVFWNFGDGTQEKRALLPNPHTYTYQKEGRYKITLRPIYSSPPGQPLCVDSSEATVVVLHVNADFIINPNSSAPIFQFHNRSYPMQALLYWDFGQASSGSDNSSTDQNPTHNYRLENRTFNICLTASLYKKCVDKVCKPVLNDYKQALEFYNVFTPGQTDQLNDEYELSIVGEQTYHLIIYDRWGVKVFESHQDAEPGDGGNWNGKVNNTGAQCPGGTYYYVFEYAYKIDPETTYTSSGVITLIR